MHRFVLQAKYIQRLKAIRATLHKSDFFQTHEVIGSSLLFVHDRTQASVWLIDFAKTIQLPTNTEITHSNNWSVGNHEDGYLIGINNLISIFEDLLNDPVIHQSSMTPSSSDEKISAHSMSSSRSHSLEDSVTASFSMNSTIQPMIASHSTTSGKTKQHLIESSLASETIEGNKDDVK